MNEKRKRELVPFVVNTGHVERPVSSKRLFREDRGRSQELEARLNALIETPITQAWDKLTAPGQVEVPDWRTQRAVALMLFMQAARSEARELEKDDSLEALLLRPDAEVDVIVGLFIQGRQLVRLGNDNPNYALFYPDMGIFAFATQDSGCLTGRAWGHAVPITPTMAYAFVSETADIAWLFDACRTTHHLPAFSFAGPKVSRVVIPPVMVDHARRNPGELSAYRSRMMKYVEQWQEARAAELRRLRAEGVTVVRKLVGGAPDAAERFCRADDAPTT